MNKAVSTSFYADDHPITEALQQWTEGDGYALDQVFPIIYDHLKRKAHYHLQHESQPTLQTTSLINEVYLRLCSSHNLKFNNRLQFFSFAGQLMHRILVERARARLAGKRGGGCQHFPLSPQDSHPASCPTDPAMLLALDEALAKLGSFDKRKFRIIQMWFFAGLDAKEIACLLEVSAATVRREVQAAKCWIAFELKKAVPA